MNDSAWNAVSDTYDETVDSQGNAIDYGPFCPREDELRLLDDLTGLCVLDVGCGGGQNAVRFARLGAQVIAVDSSALQLNHARKRAKLERLHIRIVQTDAETLQGIADKQADMVFCANVMPYVADVYASLHACARVLKPNGRLLISLDHPIRACFLDEETNELGNYPDRSYYNTNAMRWSFAGTSHTMTSWNRPLNWYTEALAEAGFSLCRILEPPVPEQVLDDLYPEDGALASLRNIPHTLILLAEA